MAREESPVGGDLDTIGIAEARSALAWWLEAGVDIAVQEEARDWLKPLPPASRPALQPPQANVVQPSQETLTELKDNSDGIRYGGGVQLDLPGPLEARVEYRRSQYGDVGDGAFGDATTDQVVAGLGVRF